MVAVYQHASHGDGHGTEPSNDRLGQDTDYSHGLSLWEEANMTVGLESSISLSRFATLHPFVLTPGEADRYKLSTRSSLHLISSWPCMMVQNVYYPETFPGERRVSLKVGWIPQQKVVAPAKWSSSPRHPPSPGSSTFSLSLLLRALDGHSDAPHDPWGNPSLFRLLYTLTPPL